MQRAEVSVTPEAAELVQGREVKSPQPHQKPQVRVLIVAPDLMTAEFLSAALTEESARFKVSVVIGNATTAIRELGSLNPHVALISEELPDGLQEGFKVLRELRRTHGATPPVMLLNRRNPDHVISAFRSGARGILYRTHSLKAVPKCLQCVHEGQIWIGNEDLEHILSWLCRVNVVLFTSADGSPLLTHREQDVVRLVVDGMKNREIANTLQLTEHSVRNYLYRIFDKLGVSSRAELILYAFSQRGGSLRPTPGDHASEGISSRSDSLALGNARMEGRSLSDA